MYNCQRQFNIVVAYGVNKFSKKKKQTLCWPGETKKSRIIHFSNKMKENYWEYNQARTMINQF